MSVSTISSLAAAPVSYQPPAASVAPATPVKAAADGDSPAVEAAETAATKKAEALGGGFAAKAPVASPVPTATVEAPSTGTSPTAGSINLLV